MQEDLDFKKISSFV